MNEPSDGAIVIAKPTHFREMTFLEELRHQLPDFLIVAVLSAIGGSIISRILFF